MQHKRLHTRHTWFPLRARPKDTTSLLIHGPRNPKPSNPQARVPRQKSRRRQSEWLQTSANTLQVRLVPSYEAVKPSDAKSVVRSSCFGLVFRNILCPQEHRRRQYHQASIKQNNRNIDGNKLASASCAPLSFQKTSLQLSLRPYSL